MSPHRRWEIRIAVFSDVHGNLSGLETVFRRIGQIPALDEIVFAGDICLFGPRPQACLDLLRSKEINSIVGNTDEWIRQPPAITDSLDKTELQRRQDLRDICAWTESRLDGDSIAWLDGLRQHSSWKSLGPMPGNDQLCVYHANPVDLLQLVFPAPKRQIELYGRVRQGDDELGALFEDVVADTIAFGHLHIPGIRTWQDKTLVNVSSVSLPGDGDPRAKFAVFEWESRSGWSIDHHYVDYSIGDEITAYRENRPPGWKASVEKLEKQGFVPQVV